MDKEVALECAIYIEEQYLKGEDYKELIEQAKEVERGKDIYEKWIIYKDSRSSRKL